VRLPAGKSWTVSSAGGAVLELQAGNTTNSLSVDGHLRVAAGAILKATDNGRIGVAIQVGPDAVLDMEGTSAHPVVFTTLEDDSVGGDLNGDSPAGIERLLELGDGSTTRIANAVFRNASDTAIYQSGGDLVANATQLGQPDGRVRRALTQAGGDAAIRGSVAVIDKAISSCDWESTERCGVDASYVDWGSADGPTGLVCGRVFTAPYLVNGAETNDLQWTSTCSSAEDPASALLSRQDRFEEAYAGVQAECARGGPGSEIWCAELVRSTACLRSQGQVAMSQAPAGVPVPEDDASLIEIGEDYVDAAGDFLIAAVKPLVPEANRPLFVGKLIGVGNTMLTLHEAYDSCSP
jgi:hypothetical protein